MLPPVSGWCIPNTACRRLGVVAVALGYITGVFSTWAGLALSHYSELSPDNGVQVETTTVDALFDGNGITGVDLIKVGVEGFEERVLDGTGKMLEEPAKFNLILEYHPPLLERSGVNHRQFIGPSANSGQVIQSIDGGLDLIPDTESALDSVVGQVWGNGLNLLCTRR